MYMKTSDRIVYEIIHGGILSQRCPRITHLNEYAVDNFRLTELFQITIWAIWRRIV